MLKYLEEQYGGRDGESVWLVCGGPSVRGFDFSQLQGTIAAINGIGRDCPHDLWFGNDHLDQYSREFWESSATKILRKSKAHELLTQRCKTAANVLAYRDIAAIDIETEFFEGRDVPWKAPAMVGGVERRKPSVMLAAMGCLYRLGFREVKLIGCDWKMAATDAYGCSHTMTCEDCDDDSWPHCGTCEGSRSVEATESHVRLCGERFDILSQWWQRLAQGMLERGFKVWNCTEGGSLEDFERADWRQKNAHHPKTADVGES